MYSGDEDMHTEFTIQSRDGDGSWKPFSFVDRCKSQLMTALEEYRRDYPKTDFRIASRMATEWVGLEEFPSSYKRGINNERGRK